MSITLEKSEKFAIRIYQLYRYLHDEKDEHVLSKNLLKAGTSIGASIAEAQYAVSRNDFVLKAKTSLKECAETEYWLNLLKDVNLITQEEYAGYIVSCKEILRLLIATVKTANQVGDS